MTTTSNTSNLGVTAATFSLRQGTTVAATDLFSATNSNTAPVMVVKFTDVSKGGGYFDFNGTILDGATIALPSSMLSQLHYHAGSQNGVSAFQVSVENTSGVWSSVSTGYATVSQSAPATVNTGQSFTFQPNPALKPHVGVGNAHLNTNAWIPASSLFAGTPTGDTTITQVKITDVGQGGSYFDLNGQIIDGTSITLTMAQVANLHLDAGKQAGSYTFQVSVADARGLWSDVGTGNVTVVAPATKPLAGAANAKLDTGATSWLPAAALYAGTSTSGAPITQVKFTDVGQGGSYFDLNGQIIDNGSITLTPAQVANLHLVAGTQPGNYTFQVSVADANGLWSAPATGHVTINPVSVVGVSSTPAHLG